MKIGFCKDDLTVLLFAVLPTTFVATILFCYQDGWSFFSLIAYPALFLIVCLLQVPDVLYLSRTISLEPDGVTVSIWKYQKHYCWNELTVFYCQNRHGISIDDWPKLGLLITAVPFRKLYRFTAQSTCIYTHPVRSVFLRFQTEDTDYTTAKLVYKGYVIEKEKLLRFLSENHIAIQDSFESA